MELEIQKTLVVSTAHMTERDDVLLDEYIRNPPSTSLTVDKVDFGWKIHVETFTESPINIFKELGFSDGFVKCILLGFINDCEWVNFDCDGPIYYFLPRYEW